MAVNGLAALTIAVIVIRKRSDIKASWPSLLILIPIFAFAVVGWELFSIHYDYTGIVDTADSAPGFVKDDSYPYPLFSDEWVNAAMDRYSIESRGLPLVNPLVVVTPHGDDHPFYGNLLVPSSSLMAELYLLSGLDPVSRFGALAAAFGLFICAALYILARKLGAGPPAASLAILCVPFLAESGNMPGVWFLLPYTLGTLAFILMLSGAVMRERVLMAVAALVSLALYPPMMVFVVPALVAAFLVMRRPPIAENKLT